MKALCSIYKLLRSCVNRPSFLILVLTLFCGCSSKLRFAKCEIDDFDLLEMNVIGIAMKHNLLSMTNVDSARQSITTRQLEGLIEKTLGVVGGVTFESGAYVVVDKPRNVIWMRNTDQNCRMFEYIFRGCHSANLLPLESSVPNNRGK